MNALGALFVGTFTGVKLADARLSSADLDGNFTSADFTGAEVYGARSVIGDLSRANFTRAVLETVQLGVPMTGANFTDADLMGASLAGDLTGAEFSGAKLTGANVDTSYTKALHVPDAAGAYVSVVPTTGMRDLSRANFNGLNLAGLALTRLDLTGATFVGADLTGTTFAADVTCPDGAPGDPSKTGAAGCRITP